MSEKHRFQVHYNPAKCDSGWLVDDSPAPFTLARQLWLDHGQHDWTQEAIRQMGLIDGKGYEAAIPLERILTDCDLQMRDDNIDDAHFETLAEALEDKAHDLTPVVLFIDHGANPNHPLTRYFIGDGNHRVAAYRYMERATIPAIIHQGGRDAAFKFALSANAEQNAKPRTRKDLRKAVTAALGQFYFVDLSKFDKIPKAKRWTFEQVAEACKTTKQTVSNIAKQLEKAAKPEPSADPDQGDGTPPTEPVQRDFFDLFDEVYQPAYQEVVRFCKNNVLLIDAKYTRADKLDALRKAKAAIDEQFDEQITALEQQES